MKCNEELYINVIETNYGHPRLKRMFDRKKFTFTLLS